MKRIICINGKMGHMVCLAVSVLLVVSLLLCLFSCADDGKDKGADTTSGYPYTFTDSTGTTVTLNKKPEVVAILFSSYAEIWKCSGGEVSVTVGESVERGFAESGVTLVDAGSGHSTIDLETLVESSPDLVIGTADYSSQREAADFCRSVGIPAALFSVESFSEYLGVLKIFCDINGNEAAYIEYGVNVKAGIDFLLDKVRESIKLGEIQNKRILFVRAGSSANSTKAKNSSDNFVCMMLGELGCENIADGLSELQLNLSMEEIISENPEYMFISTMGDDAAAKEYMNSQLSSDGWKELDCVKDQDYEYLPRDMFHYKPNARWGDAYEYLIKILYPELSFD